METIYVLYKIIIWHSGKNRQINYENTGGREKGSTFKMEKVDMELCPLVCYDK